MNSIKTLKKNLFVYKNGNTRIPLNIINDYIDFEIKKIPFIFNKKITKINFIKNIDDPNIEVPVHFLPFKQVEDTIIFNFSRNQDLKKFLNKNYDVQLNIEQQNLILNFKNIKEERQYITIINDGVLTLTDKTPLDILYELKRKMYYYSLKTSCFKEQHSENFTDLYDILISSNEKNLKYFLDTNTFLQKESDKNLHYLFLQKKEYSDFLKPVSTIHLRIYLKKKPKSKENSIYFPLNDSLYDKFLLKNKYFTLENLTLEKQKIIKGTAVYFRYIKTFLENIISRKMKIQKEYYKLIKEIFGNIDFNDYDFTNIKKREKFSARIKIIFLDNQDIFITRDLNFNLDPKTDVFAEELSITWKKGFDKYVSDYQFLLSTDKNSKLEESEIKTISEILSNLRLMSKVDINVRMTSIIFYYASILKSKLFHFKKHPLFQNRSIDFYKKIPIVLSIFNLFKEEYPTHELCLSKSIYFQEYFIEDKSMSKLDLMKMFVFASDILYFFHISQDLKYFKRVYSHKFEDPNLLNDILILSYDLCKIAKNRLQFGYHSLSATVFALFVLALGLDKEKNQDIKGKFPSDQYLSNVRLVLETEKMITFVRGKESIQIPKELILSSYSLDPTIKQTIKLRQINIERDKYPFRGNFGKWIISSKISLSSICNSRYFQMHVSSLYQKIEKFVRFSYGEYSVKESKLFSNKSRKYIRSSIVNFFLSSFITRLNNLDRFKRLDGSIDPYKFNTFISEIFHKISFFLKNSFSDINEKYITDYFIKLQQLIKKNKDILTNGNIRNFEHYFNFQIH